MIGDYYFSVAAAIQSSHYGTIVLGSSALPQGYIVSHDSFGFNAEDSYPQNTDSNVTIIGLTPNSRIDIEFTVFDLYENTRSACSDYVEIAGVSQYPQGQPLPKICGRGSREGEMFLTVYMLTDKLVIRFVSGAFNDRHSGFMLQYNVVNYVPPVTTTVSLVTTTVPSIRLEDPITNATTTTKPSTIKIDTTTATKQVTTGELLCLGQSKLM